MGARTEKFYDLEVAHKSPVATEALQRIAALYAIEKEIRGRPPDERREVRNTRSRPRLFLRSSRCKMLECE
jgi:hypothetical protein